MVTTDSNHVVHPTDLALIRELEIDPRQSYHDLAAKLGKSVTTVHRRIQRLLKEGMVDLICLPDPVSLGFSVQSFIGINVLGGRADAVADELASFGCIKTANITAGRYDILAWADFKDSNDFLDFIQRKLGSIPDLATIETMTALRIAKNRWWSDTGISDEFSASKSTHRDLDLWDLSLVRELEVNARLTSSELAQRIGADRHTVQRRLGALLNDRIISFYGIANPRALGYTVVAAILVKVHPGKIDSVLNDLASKESINHLIVTTGRYEVVAWANFRDNEDMSSFVRGELTDIPGIISHETMINLRTAKRSFRLLTADHCHELQGD